MRIKNLIRTNPTVLKAILALTGLLALIATSANAQFIYASRVTGTTWTPPWWEIRNGGTAYSTSAGLSGQSGLPTRSGAFIIPPAHCSWVKGLVVS